MLRTLDIYHLETFIKEAYILKYICNNKDRILTSNINNLSYKYDEDANVFENGLPIYEYDQTRYKNNKKYNLEIQIDNMNIDEEIEFTFNMDICNCFLVDKDNCYNYIENYINSFEDVLFVPDEILVEYTDEDGEYVDNSSNYIFETEEIVLTSNYIDEYIDKYKDNKEKMNVLKDKIEKFIREVIDNDMVLVDIRNSKNPYFHKHEHGLHHVIQIPNNKYQICCITLYCLYDSNYAHTATKIAFLNNLKELNALLRGELDD